MVFLKHNMTVLKSQENQNYLKITKSLVQAVCLLSLVLGTSQIIQKYPSFDLLPFA